MNATYGVHGTRSFGWSWVRAAAVGGAVCVLGLSGSRLAAQSSTPGTDALRHQLELRYELLPLHDGVALRPKAAAHGVRSIEVAGDTIAVDGVAMTGAELRARLGADADLVLRLSYLDSAARRSLALPAGASSSSAPPPPASMAVPPVPPPAPVPPEPSLSWAEPRRGRHQRADRVRFGDGITVGADEVVDGDIVAIGGPVSVLGEVDGDVVAVGGGVELGPASKVSKDVVVIGGRLDRSPTAQIGGTVHEGGFGFDHWRRPMMQRMKWRPGGGSPFGLFATLMRAAVLCLLAAIVMLLGGEYITRIETRAASEPVKAGAIGLLAQILFLPVLVVTIVGLVVTIVGIPLLLLVPFALLGLGLVALVGFTAVAHFVGVRLAERFGRQHWGRYATTTAGVLVLLAPIVLGRLIGLGGGVLFPITISLLIIGWIVEYVAWTVGFGAVALARFRKTVVAPPPLTSPS